MFQIEKTNLGDDGDDDDDIFQKEISMILETKNGKKLKKNWNNCLTRKSNNKTRYIKPPGELDNI